MNAPGSGPPGPDDPARLPETIEEWQRVADARLSPPCCAFHRNVEISSAYAWLYRQSPERLKWAAMAAIASHHIRLVLFPLRLNADRTGYIDLPRAPGRRGRFTVDADIIRETNNAIFDDIFWVHLAYLADDDGLDRLRRLLGAMPHYATVLSGFAAIDEGRDLLAPADVTAERRRRGEDLIWRGNVILLDHEQRVVVQPYFDRLSRLFVRLMSWGATTSFEVRGIGQEVRYFTSFYLYSVTGGLSSLLRARTWPRITRLEDRWRWLESSVVPRFRRLDTMPSVIDACLTRVVDDGRHHADAPCVIPGVTWR